MKNGTPYKSFFKEKSSTEIIDHRTPRNRRPSNSRMEKQRIIARLSEKYDNIEDIEPMDDHRIPARKIPKGFGNIPLEEQTEEIQAAIEALRDGKFGNKAERMEFVKLILPLALSTDAQARKFIKAVGDLATEIFGETTKGNDEETMKEKKNGWNVVSQKESKNKNIFGEEVEPDVDDPVMVEVDGQTVERYSFRSDTKEEFQGKRYQGSSGQALKENTYEEDIDVMIAQMEKDKETQPLKEVIVPEKENDIVVHKPKPTNKKPKGEGKAKKTERVEKKKPDQKKLWD